MNNDIIIDGTNITQEFGARLLKGSIASLIAYPQMKAGSLSTNVWHEEDGEEVDLHNPKLSSREISISIFAKNGDSSYSSIAHLLNDGVYHNVEFKSIGKTLKLRAKDISNVTKTFGAAVFTITMVDDYPLRGYTYVAPTKGFPFSSLMSIDEIPMSDYGIRVLKGTTDSLLKLGQVRENVSRDISIVDGTIYGGTKVSLSAKDITLNLLMVADNTTTFMRNWNAFLYNLSRPNAREVEFADMGFFESYYKSCSVTEYVNNGSRVWCKFAITLRCMGEEYGFFVDSFGNLQCIVPSTKETPDINVNVNSAFDVIMVTDGEASKLLFGINEGNLVLSK